MTEIAVMKCGKGFEYDPAPQRSPEWRERRLGKVTASKLEDWLSVSKAKNTLGKPLQKRIDYEKEILFERKFKVAYENFVSEAMQDGIDFEDFAALQYEQTTGNKTFTVGCWFNDYFVASPDRGVGDDGLLEIKVVRDNTFTSIITDGVPQKWWKQIQGQLWGSGRAWCDFVAINLNTKKMIIIRVYPDPEFHEWLEIAVPEPITIDSTLFDIDNMFDFVGSVPLATKNEESEFGF